MNFKINLTLFTLLFILGCGVKSKPLRPHETAIKSYINSYTAPTAPINPPVKKEQKPSIEKKQ